MEIYMGLKTSQVKVKSTKPDYKNSLTPQERYMENVERGYTTTEAAKVAVKYEVIDGVRYKVMTI